MKFLSGTALAALLSVAAVPVAVAESMPGEEMSQEQMSEPVSLQDARPDWEVQSIRDGQLTLKLQEGDATQTFMIAPEAVQELALQNGSTIELNYDNVMVGTVAAATQTNIDVDVEGRERITYLIPESGNDYDLGDQVVVTPDRVLSELSEWQLSATDITVIDPEVSSSSTVTSEVQASSTSIPVTEEVESTDTDEVEVDEVETQTEVEPVPGLW
ncbi:MAG: hypothetical protein AAF329_15040 [Cyanobacteria bacterium P01_A01_bin.17]